MYIHVFFCSVMKRKDFLKRALLGGAAAAISPTLAFAHSKKYFNLRQINGASGV